MRNINSGSRKNFGWWGGSDKGTNLKVDGRGRILRLNAYDRRLYFWRWPEVVSGDLMRHDIKIRLDQKQFTEKHAYLHEMCGFRE